MTDPRLQDEAPARPNPVRAHVHSNSTRTWRATYAKAPAFARRPKPRVEPIFPPLDARSTEFWYPDGNIVANVEGTYFRLLQSRLERHCGYFTNPLWSTINGQKVVEVQDIKLHDFEMFLRYLEVPM